jgi:hypothetical protein
MRARTRPGRLRALDAWLLHEHAPLLSRARQVVDVGFGESPVTVYELADALRAAHPALAVHGVEQVAYRVPPPPWPEGVTLGADGVQGPVSVVRAMNVLRGLGEADAAALQTQLGQALEPDGLLLEGSSDTDGHLLTCHVLRRGEGGLAGEVLFFSDFSRGFSPWQFRDWLPRDLRRNVKPGTAVHALLTSWDEAITHAGAREPVRRFLCALDLVPGLAATSWEREHGFVRWIGYTQP